MKIKNGKHTTNTTARKDKMALAGLLLAFGFMLLLAQFASASIAIDGVSTDPSVIAAGDEVLVSVNFHDDASEWYSRMNDGDYRLNATLQPGDTASAAYVDILDGEGQRSVGHLFAGQTWSKTYRIKVHDDAPVGTYQFKMGFQYFRDDAPADSPQQEYFTLSISKEGIILNLANIATDPAEVRPGDDYVTLITYLENSGRKDAKAIEFTLDMPDGFSAPYANDNRVYTGYLAAGAQQSLTTHFNVAQELAPGTYEFVGHLSYSDLNDNHHEKMVRFPVRIREKPILVVMGSEGSVRAGAAGELRVTVKNIGTEKAEAVDVRLIKQSSQPFSFDARSDFVGTIAPGEEAEAVFTLDANSEAAQKKHSFTALIRAKGDSDLGDDRVYTFSRDATITVSGQRPNYWLYTGAGLVVIVLFALLFVRIGKRRK